MLGDVVFYGKGAGKLPPASAVVADVIDALKHGVKIHDSLFWQESAPIEGRYGDSTPADHYVRLENEMCIRDSPPDGRTGRIPDCA